jgi:hypothetical protein
MAAESPSFASSKAAEVFELLIRTYGERPLKPRREPMHELISMIPMPASASTTVSLISSPVFRHQLPDWLDTSCTMS